MPGTSLADMVDADRVSARRTAFRFQDGVMLAATVRAFDALGLFDPGSGSGLPDTGYQRAGWRCLASAGWLDTAEPPAEGSKPRWTHAGLIAMRHRDRYVTGGRFLARFASNDPVFWTTPWNAETTSAFVDLLDDHERWRAGANPEDEAITHLDATLAVPALLSLRASGGLERPEGPFARLLTTLGWLDGGGDWTAAGRAHVAFVDHFGLVGSYLPMLARLEDLYRGDVVVTPGEGEWHCHRQLNVAASAAAHRRYFADADPIFRDVFERGPRPTFIADMGCGDGSWLVHLHGIFGDSVRYVGIDASPVALDYARSVMTRSGLSDPLLLLGDVTNPDRLRGQLAAHGLAIEDGLHIRSFLDHDRTYRGAARHAGVPGWSTGAYVAPGGRPLNAVEVESDLVAHLRRWTPHVRKHGMVVLEAHCVAPAVARRHLGELHAVAFDAYHALSHQYPIEHSAFVRCCQLAGLQSAGYVERRYPATRPFVAVSLNRLMPKQPALPRRESARQDTWQPDAGTDLADGRALHRLLYVDGDLDRPRSWCSGATGVVVGDLLETIEARTEQARPGDVVRILDYGAGTGLASIELSKACLARGIEQRLADRGATFELHLVDIPGPWFAQGHDLLREVPWTRFHALRAADGRFRPLLEVMGGQQVDGVAVNMVFHLLTEPAMRQAAQSIADVLRPGGRLAFSSPDLSPRTPYALLFHDPNRLLRRRWLEALDSSAPANLPAVLRRAVAAVRPDDRPTAQRRADRRILPTARTAEAVAGALEPFFRGDTHHRGYELLAEESMMTALVPANQAEYLAEIADPALREEVIRHLMGEEVLPTLMDQRAGTALGLNIQWTLGRFTRLGHR